MILNKLSKFAVTLFALFVLSACATMHGILGNNEEDEGSVNSTNNTQQAQSETRAAADAKPSAQASTQASMPEGGEPQSMKVRAVAKLLVAQPRLGEVLRAPNAYELHSAGKSLLTQSQRSALMKVLGEYREGRFEQALASINALDERVLATSAAYVLRGDIYLALNQSDKAQQDYEQALKLNAHNYKAANRLAKLLREEGEFAKAKAYYDRAIESYPAHANSYRNRAVLLDLYLGDKQGAKADYEMYVSLLEYAQVMRPLANDTFKDEQRRLIRSAKGWLLDLERQLASARSAQ